MGYMTMLGSHGMKLAVEPLTNQVLLDSEDSTSPGAAIGSFAAESIILLGGFPLLNFPKDGWPIFHEEHSVIFFVLVGLGLGLIGSVCGLAGSTPLQ